jgi:hypothetical protein
MMNKLVETRSQLAREILAYLGGLMRQTSTLPAY